MTVLNLYSRQMSILLLFVGSSMDVCPIYFLQLTSYIYIALKRSQSVSKTISIYTLIKDIDKKRSRL